MLQTKTTYTKEDDIDLEVNSNYSSCIKHLSPPQSPLKKTSFLKYFFITFESFKVNFSQIEGDFLFGSHRIKKRIF